MGDVLAYVKLVKCNRSKCNRSDAWKWRTNRHCWRGPGVRKLNMDREYVLLCHTGPLNYLPNKSMLSVSVYSVPWPLIYMFYVGSSSCPTSSECRRWWFLSTWHVAVFTASFSQCLSNIIDIINLIHPFNLTDVNPGYIHFLNPSAVLPTTSFLQIPNSTFNDYFQSIVDLHPHITIDSIITSHRYDLKLQQTLYSLCYINALQSFRSTIKSVHDPVRAANYFTFLGKEYPCCSHWSLFHDQCRFSINPSLTSISSPTPYPTSILLSSMLKVGTLLLVVPFAVFVRRLVMLSFSPLPTFAITPVPPHVNKIGTSFGPSMKRKENDLTSPYITLPTTQFLSS